MVFNRGPQKVCPICSLPTDPESTVFAGAGTKSDIRFDINFKYNSVISTLVTLKKKRQKNDYYRKSVCRWAKAGFQFISQQSRTCCIGGDFGSFLANSGDFCGRRTALFSVFLPNPGHICGRGATL